MKGTYGARLKYALALRGRSRKELAEFLGISVQAVGQVINGPTVALTAENHEKAVRLLGIDGYWLATGIGDAEPKALAWPFKRIDLKKVQALNDEQLAAVETSVIIYAERQGADISIKTMASTA